MATYPIGTYRLTFLQHLPRSLPPFRYTLLGLLPIISEPGCLFADVRLFRRGLHRDLGEDEHRNKQ